MKYIFKSKENDEMNHSAHLLGSSLSRVQGYPQDGWYWQMNEWMNEWMTRGDQASVSEACNFIFKRDFYTLTCTQRKMKDARSCRISPNTPAVLLLSKPGFFFAYFSHNNVVYIIFWPWRPVNILWPSFDKGCSTRKLIFPWKEVFFFFIFLIYVNLKK